MTYFIIGLVIAVVAFSIWYAKKVDSDPSHKLYKGEKTNAISVTPDLPVSFGYKTSWFAIKTNDVKTVSELIAPFKWEKCNWESGIKLSYESMIFITPPVDNWILVTGSFLPNFDTDTEANKVKILLNKLSVRFGEAHYFSTHRASETHAWIKSVKGEVNRLYSLNDVEINEGDLTLIEQDVDFSNVNEDVVMQIAESWSVNPALLENRDSIKGLGLVIEAKKFNKSL